ncbi:protein Niban 1 isoform X2 [Alosa pseudoharengus]|uniref:protein Niban 1 isoform X2 n=1 Tax=Alosa pseudoharengus TaxID=34774 RepID=UPI003F8877A3
MGGSTSSQLDETTSNYIKEHTETVLKGFGPHFRRQYRVTLCSQLQEELEQQNTSPALLLKQREQAGACEVLYEGSVSQCEDAKRWKDRWATLRDHSLELHDNQEMCKRGTPARQKLNLVGGTVVTSREKYEALVNKAIPDLNNGQEDSAPELVPSTAFPVYLRLPYRRDVYLCCHDDEQRRHFLCTLSHSIRHQNHDSLHKPTCEMQAFLAAIHFHRQEKGHYESWDMLVGDDAQVLTHLVMEGLIPYLQKELIPQLKGKRAEKRRAWLSLVEAAHTQVLAQAQEALQSLKEECSAAAQQQGVLLRSNMDQISSSCAFLETKLKAMVLERTQSVCAEHVNPYLSSVLEELLGPVNGGFQAVRQLCDEQLERLCRDVRQGWTFQQVQQALQQASKTELEESFQRLDALHEKLQELQQRFSFSNTTKLVQGAQKHMQQLMDNAMYTFESLLQSTEKDNPAQLGSVMEKAKMRVLKQYDYDSSTVRKQFFQEALMDITLPVLRRHLSPSCRPELEKFEQYIFADCTDFINVENVYEDILKKTLTPEVNKVVKEAASQKKHNLFVDSSDLQAISQGSLSGSRTPPPPLSDPSSPSKQAGATCFQFQPADLKPSPLASRVGASECQKEVAEEPQEQQEKQVEEVKKEEQQPKEEQEPLRQQKEQVEEVKKTEEQQQPKEELEPLRQKEEQVEEVKKEEQQEKQVEEIKKEEQQPKEELEPLKQQEEQAKEQDRVAQVALPPVELEAEVSPEPPSSPEALSFLEEPGPVPTDSSTACTDRAIYLNPPAGVPAGSAVPLAEDDDDLTPPVLTQVAEAEASSIPPGSSSEETTTTTTTMAAVVAAALTPQAGGEGSVEETEGGGGGGGGASLEGSGGQSAEGETTSFGLVTSEPTAEGAKALPSGTRDAEEDDKVESFDCVKAIRDLVVEVIEVEDTIKPCPDGSST